MKAQLISAVLILSWGITPESLVLLGQISGYSGFYVVLPLLFGVLLIGTSSVLIYNPGLFQKGMVNEVDTLANVFGKLTALTAIMFGRVPLLLFASTALLVSAGFAFNEIFVYWFPNFLFASLLLGLICLLNLFNEEFALWGQVVFVFFTVTGIILLIFLGITGGNESVVELGKQQHSVSLSILALAVLFFVGFDFCWSKEVGLGLILKVLAVLFSLLFGWALLAVEYESSLRLIHSSISHILVAKTVGGELGHKIIGFIIIGGALSGANGLLIAARRSFTLMADQGYLPKIMRTRWFIAILAAVIIEIMMMTGFAGEEILETQLKASLLLWLLYLGLRSFAAGYCLKKISVGFPVLGAIVFGTFLVMMGCLVLTDGNMRYILVFQLVSVFVFLLFSSVLAKSYVGISQK